MHGSFGFKTWSVGVAAISHTRTWGQPVFVLEMFVGVFLFWPTKLQNVLQTICELGPGCFNFFKQQAQFASQVVPQFWLKPPYRAIFSLRMYLKS